MKRSKFLAICPSIKSSTEWSNYYQSNADDQLNIPWEDGAHITPQERDLIAHSIQAWQLGETSDGVHLLTIAQKYALAIDDPVFPDVVRLFIAEEQRHGQNLGRFLDLAQIPRIKRNWGDTSFRLIRYFLLNMELWATSVVMVETIALIYYKALRQATKSTVLRQICKQILRDEVAHIRFQCERLAVLHRSRPVWHRALTYGLHRLFFGLILIAVWIGHHRTLKAGGYDSLTFWRIAWRKMTFAWQMMRPERYKWNNIKSQSLLHN